MSLLNFHRTESTHVVENQPVNGFAEYLFSRLPAGVDLLAYIAGGALRAQFDGTLIKDIDLFFSSDEDFRLALSFFKSDPRFWFDGNSPQPDRAPTFLSDHPAPVNLIGFRYKSSLVELIESFDFTCACIGAEKIDRDTVVVRALNGAERDASDRIIRVNHHQGLKRIAKRITRYVNNYAYRLDDGIGADLVKCSTLPEDHENYLPET